MKKIIFIACLLLIAVLFAGCTQTEQPKDDGSGLMTLDDNKNNADTNNSGRNSNVFNNLNQIVKAKAGDNVAVNYIGRLTDGTIFDSSVGKSPLEFTVSAGQMIKGFDAAIVGMKVGETKSISILSKDAYGEYDKNKVVVLDANNFADFHSLTKGMKVVTGNLRGTVTEKNDKNAMIDFNHELAGKTLIFEIILVSIN